MYNKLYKKITYVPCYERNLRFPTREKYKAYFEKCPRNTSLALGPGLVLSEAQRFFPVSLPSEAMDLLFEVQELLAEEETLGASCDLVSTSRHVLTLLVLAVTGIISVSTLQRHA